MSSRTRHFVILWLVATTLHLPFPVVDWDEHTPGAQDSPLAQLDVDFILLGCVPPQDADHGPMGEDPEPGNHQIGPFPLYFLASDRDQIASQNSCDGLTAGSLPGADAAPRCADPLSRPAAATNHSSLHGLSAGCQPAIRC